MERLLKVHGPKRPCVREQGNGSGHFQLGCLGGFWDVVWDWLGCKEWAGTGKEDESFGCVAVGWGREMAQPNLLSSPQQSSLQSWGWYGMSDVGSVSLI